MTSTISNAPTRLRSLLLLIALLLTGCGSSSSNSPISGASAPPAQSGLVFGRAILNAPAQGATADLTDLSGNPLPWPSVKVDSSGNFRIPANLAALPPEFRVRVTLTGDSPWNLPIVANVSGYTNQNAVYPNILSTAVALYQANHGVSQAAAVSRIKAIFGIPAEVDLGYGVDESKRSYFRHSRFLSQAADNGGVAAHLSSLLQAQPVAGQLIEEDASPGLGAQVGTSIIANIGADAILFVSDKAFGLVAQALGLNIGNSDQTQEVAQQLTDIEDSLTSLSTQITADFNQLTRLSETETLFNTYLTLTTSLNPVLIGVQVQTQDLAAVAQTSTITNAPFIPSQGLKNVLSGISEIDAQSSLDQLATALLGRNQTASLLRVYLQLLAFSAGIPPFDLASSDTVVWSDTPVLSNTRIFDPFERFLAFYAQQQTLALNLLVEDANLSLSPTSVDDARESAIEFQAALVQQLAYLRYPQASDFFFANPGSAILPRTKSPYPASPSGTIFYTQMQDRTEGYADLNKIYDPRFKAYAIQSDGGQALIATAKAFQAPGAAQGWRLPTLDELNQLRGLALQAHSGDAVAGLQSLGFTLPPSFQAEPLLWYTDYDDPEVNGFYDQFEVAESDLVKAYDFTDGTIYGYTAEEAVTFLFEKEWCYLEVRPQSYDATQTYESIVATGFRPTTPPTLALSADRTRVTATFNGEDISRYCVWSSSNPQQLEVRGLAQDAGLLVWHPTGAPLGSQTITATLAGMDATTCVAKTLQSTLLVGVPEPTPTPVLSGILLSPSNTVLLDSSTATVFTATGFYQDHNLVNLSQQVTWSLERPDGTPYPANKATINGSIPGILTFTGPILGDSVVVVKASLGGVVGETQLEVASPL